jgi:hypothetical protein
MNTTMTNAEAATNAQAASVAEQGAHVPPGKAPSTKAASRKKGAPKAKKGRESVVTKARGQRANPAVNQGTKASIPREFSKKAIVLDLLRRKDGATLAEIAKATEWEHHSIRGFISGTIARRMGLVVESARNAQGERTYRVAK